MVGHLADIITYAKFQGDISRGYDFTGDRISHFPINFCMGLTTVQRDCAVCDLWIIGNISAFVPHLKLRGTGTVALKFVPMPSLPIGWGSLLPITAVIFSRYYSCRGAKSAIPLNANANRQIRNRPRSFLHNGSFPSWHHAELRRVEVTCCAVDMGRPTARVALFTLSTVSSLTHAMHATRRSLYSTQAVTENIQRKNSIQLSYTSYTVYTSRTSSMNRHQRLLCNLLMRKITHRRSRTKHRFGYSRCKKIRIIQRTSRNVRSRL